MEKSGCLWLGQIHGDSVDSHSRGVDYGGRGEPEFGCAVTGQDQGISATTQFPGYLKAYPGAGSRDQRPAQRIALSFVEW
jgi:hypothetical protein